MSQDFRSIPRARWAGRRPAARGSSPWIPLLRQQLETTQQMVGALGDVEQRLQRVEQALQQLLGRMNELPSETPVMNRLRAQQSGLRM